MSPVESMFFAINTAMFNGLTLTYVRGADSIEDVPANRGHSSLVVDDGGGARVQGVSSDFLVLARYLVIGGSQITPAKGDRVQITVGGVTQTYELMSPPFDPSDLDGTLLRLHTKLVATA